MDNQKIPYQTIRQILGYAGGILILASILDFIPAGTLCTILQSLGALLMALSFLFDTDSAKGVKLFFSIALVALTMVNLLSALHVG